MQMSDEILVLSVKEQKLKHWSGCTRTHKRVPFLSTPGCLFFLFFLGRNSPQACAPYLCKQTTGKSKDTAPPNLCVQACHTELFKQRRGPWALPLSHTDAEVSHLRRCLRKKRDLHNPMWSAQQGCNPDKIYANQPWARLRLQKMTDSTDVLHYFNQTSTG